MPIYEYKCNECGSQEDAFRHVSERKNGPECECGGDMGLILSPVRLNPILGAPGFEGYECVVTGEYVTSRKRRKEIMKENGLVEKDKGTRAA